MSQRAKQRLYSVTGSGQRKVRIRGGQRWRLRLWDVHGCSPSLSLANTNRFVRLHWISSIFWISCLESCLRTHMCPSRTSIFYLLNPFTRKTISFERNSSLKRHPRSISNPKDSCSKKGHVVKWICMTWLMYSLQLCRTETLEKRSCPSLNTVRDPSSSHGPKRAEPPRHEMFFYLLLFWFWDSTTILLNT